MADVHKVRIKIGDAEFEAEGSEESVKLQFDSFLAALSARGTTTPQVQADRKTAGNGFELPPPPSSGLEKAQLDRAFSIKDNVVSLRVLPQTQTREADTLLMLVYGFAAIKSQDMVLGTQLIKAARVSGLNLDRIDRAIGRHDQYLLKGGARKGMKYGLNNPGRAAAEEMIRQLIT